VTERPRCSQPGLCLRVPRRHLAPLIAVVLLLAGCGSSSNSASQSHAATPAATSPPSTTATSATTTSTAAAQFNAELAPLLADYDAAVIQYNAACCAGLTYAAAASAIRTYQAAETSFADRLTGLTPPSGVGVSLQNYLVSIRADVGYGTKLLTAVLAHDPAAINTAINASNAAARGRRATLNDLLVALGDQTSDVVGFWTGRVSQHGPGTTTLNYDVEMNITGSTPGAIAGTIRYPSLNCAGQLQLTRAQGGVLYIYREHITSGGGSCSAGGTIYATVLGGSMSWRWVATGIEVSGELGHPQKP
jgi:hypothetical protein